MTWTNGALTELLDRLLAGWENEVVEFKEAARQFSADKTGEFVSAPSNEANLRGYDSGWLIFGVSNARQVVGTAHLIDVQQRPPSMGACLMSVRIGGSKARFKHANETNTPTSCGYACLPHMRESMPCRKKDTR